MISFKKKGFALLYAVLISALVAIVGLLISDIITNQIIFSSINKQSVVNYYTADSIRACANYYDKNYSFGTIIKKKDGWKYKEPASSPEKLICGDDVANLKTESLGKFSLQSYPYLSYQNASAGSFNYQFSRPFSVSSCVNLLIRQWAKTTDSPPQDIAKLFFVTAENSDCEEENARTVITSVLMSQF